MTDPIQLPGARPMFAVALLIVLWMWESASPFFVFRRGSERLRHGGKNMAFGIFNGLVTSLGFIGLWWWIADWALRHQFGVLHWLDLPSVVAWPIAILMLDGWTYFWHRLNHRSAFLWRFHRMHHSDNAMDVTTANRFHTGEIVLSSVLRIPVIALAGVSLGQLAVYETLMFAVVQFHHANIGIPAAWDRALRIVIVTPHMHKVHHSRWQPETDSNYSSLLSIWDRLFRSFRLHDDPRQLRVGLDEFDDPVDQSLPGMIATPGRHRVKKTGSVKR